MSLASNVEKFNITILRRLHSDRVHRLDHHIYIYIWTNNKKKIILYSTQFNVWIVASSILPEVDADA